MSAKKDNLSFVEHLEALRGHLLRSFIAIAVVMVGCFVGKEFIFGVVIFGPYQPDFISFVATCNLSQFLSLGDALCLEQVPYEIKNIQVTGQFLTHLKVSFIIGIIIASPYVFWEIWRFVKPGLYKKEIRSLRGIVFICAFLFIFGVSFGYFVITPFSLNFMGSYTLLEDGVPNEFTLQSYIAFITMICLSAGLIFELPIAAYFLSKLGILTPKYMKKYRKHAFVVILVLSAILTPPDVVSQVLIAIPIFLLYEVSINISRRVNKKREEKLNEE